MTNAGKTSTAAGPTLREAEQADPEPSPGIAADRVYEARGWAPAEALEAAVSSAVWELAQRPEVRGWMPCQVTLVFADDAAVRELNRSYRGQDKPTNVLSFEAPPLPAGVGDGLRFLGDVVLARETVEREAADLAIPFLHHVQHLVVHGLLHLMGFDHIDDADASRMEALETAVLAGLGIADPYASDPTDP